MTETPQKRPLFRPEAVEHHAKARVGGRRIDLGDVRVTWLFRGLLAAIALAILLAFTIQTETHARGAALVTGTGSTATVFVTTSRLPSAGTVVLHVGGREVTGSITGTAGPGELTVRLHQRMAPRARGDATIPLGERSVAALLLGWDR